MSSSTTGGERDSVESPGDEIQGFFHGLLTMETLGGDASSLTSSTTTVGDSPAVADAAPGRLGEYRILREIGRGGMGVVYEAEQESLGRRVALKVLPRDLLANSSQVLRFQREARSAARLHHTNIVPVFGVGHDDGTHFYVMQFIEGRGLDVVAEELRRSARPTAQPASGPRTDFRAPESDAAAVAPTDLSRARHADEPAMAESAKPILETESDIFRLSGVERSFARGVARIGVQVADALAHAHAQGILHRDIKPSNLLLDRNGNVWVADFGLAKAIDADDVTRTGDIVGTIRYMAPERFSGVADERGDIYALGLSLYELLALRPAFPERDRAGLIRQVTHEDPPRLRKLNGRVPLDLETIVHKAMAREPGRRYATAAALADDLRRFLDGRPIEARRAGVMERCRRWCLRNPLPAWLISGVALSLVAGSAVSTVLAIRAFANSRRADLEAQRANAEKRRSEDRLYVAEMGLAQQSWREDRIDQMREHLEIIAPQRPGARDLRGFEWYYLRRLCDATSQTLRGHTGEVWCLSFSPDGRRLASSGAWDGSVKFWDVGSGRLIRTHTRLMNGVSCVTYSPDGKSFATGGGDTAVRLWDAASGALVQTLRGHTGSVVSAAYSPDGERIATSGSDATIKIWDIKTGRELRTLSGHANGTTRVSYSGDGARLASAGRDGALKIWDPASGALLRTLDAHPGYWAWGLAFSPDGSRIASCGGDFTVRLWDAASGRELFVLSGHGDAVHTVAFSPDGRRLASSSVDGTVRLWDAASGRTLRTLNGLAGTGHCVKFSPDGRRLAACDSEGSVKLWNVVSEQDALTLRGHVGAVASVTLSPDGRRIASAGADKTVRLWDADSGQEAKILRGHFGTIHRIAYRPDGRRLATAGDDRTIRLWDADTGRELRILRGHTGPIRGLAFGRDGRSLASCGEDRSVRFWDADTGRPGRILRGHTDAILGLASSPDGRLLATASADKTLKLWNAETGDLVRTFSGHTSGVVDVAFSPDGRRLASVGNVDGTVRLWNVETGDAVRVLRANMSRTSDVVFSPDGGRLAAAGGGTVKLWNAETGQLVFTLSGQAGSSRGLAFGPDGRRLAAGAGPTVKLWDATPPTAELRTIREAADLVEFLFSLKLTTSGVLNRVRNNPALGAEVRAHALELAERYGERLLDQSAERVVNSWYGRRLLRPAVLESLRSDNTLSEPMRQRALALAERIPETPSLLNHASWVIVSKPGATPDAYRRALRYAEAACRLMPNAGTMLNTLGVAQFRTERYREAAATLTESDRLNSESATGPEPADVAFLALAHHRLGESNQARTALARLRVLMEKPSWAGDSEAQSFLHEAEAIDLDLAFPADPFAR